MEEELVTIAKAEYESLLDDSKWYRIHLNTITECAQKLNVAVFHRGESK